MEVGRQQEWKSLGNETQLLGQAIVILFFCSLGSSNRAHFNGVFFVCVSLLVFIGKTSTKSAPEQNSETQKSTPMMH